MIHSMGGGAKGKVGAKGQDSEGDLHIINQLRKIKDLQIAQDVKFQDKSYMMVDVWAAEKILGVYDNLKTSIQKEALTLKLWKDSITISRISELYDMINSSNNKNKKGINSHGTVDQFRRSRQLS